METKEELWREYAKWTDEYVKANDARCELLPCIPNLSKGEQMTSFVPTQELIAQIDETHERMTNAWRKQREVLEKLQEQGSQ